MELNNFIHLTIKEIKSGIDSFNNSSETYKAFYPKDIDFDLAVTETKYGIEVINADMETARDVNRLKLNIIVENYPNLKKDK
jgi:hypothetical protein